MRRVGAWLVALVIVGVAAVAAGLVPNPLAENDTSEMTEQRLAVAYQAVISEDGATLAWPKTRREAVLAILHAAPSLRASYGSLEAGQALPVGHWTVQSARPGHISLVGRTGERSVLILKGTRHHQEVREATMDSDGTVTRQPVR